MLWKVLPYLTYQIDYRDWKSDQICSQKCLKNVDQNEGRNEDTIFGKSDEMDKY